MRRAIVVFAMLAAAVLGGAGCTMLENPTADANKAIAAANVHLKAFQASDTKVQKLAEELNSLDVSPEGATKALEITAQVKAELATQKQELAAGSEAIAAIKSLEVTPDFKKYADLEIAAIAAQIAVVDEGVKLYDEMDRLYTAIRDKKNTPTFTNEMTAAIDAVYARVQELSTTASKAKSEAEAYFEKAAASVE